MVFLIGTDKEVDWAVLGRQLGGRSARQCRERWVNYLAPTIRNEPWTEDEDRLLVEKINELGHSWTTICHFFNGRSENDVKNRWYSHLKFRSEFDATTHRVTIMPGDATAAFVGRKKRIRVKVFPKQNAQRILEMQARAFRRRGEPGCGDPCAKPADVGSVPGREDVSGSFSPFEFEDEKEVAYSEFLAGAF